MPYLKIHVTEEELEQAEKWKALADELGLDYEEFRELMYHMTKVYKILKKNKKKRI